MCSASISTQGEGVAKGLLGNIDDREFLKIRVEHVHAKLSLNAHDKIKWKQWTS